MTLMPNCRMLGALAMVLPIAEFSSSLAAQEAPRVTFAQVRPIFAANCFGCHGPDANKRRGGPKGSGGFRLDTRKGLSMALDEGLVPVLAGKPDRSEILRRISAHGEERMPPEGKGARLSQADIALLRSWIAGGAEWTPHWSDIGPRRPRPKIESSWARNPIDNFVAHRLERAGLRPAAEADRLSLIRRLSLDLTGLPPSLSETERFVTDTKAGAYFRAVDRLLASPKFGERWAAPWLDLARYADSAGYADDPPRTIWAWRDWVIRALNANMPFDQFTIEQLAGDLLPDPSSDQLIATAFHRNTMTNSEGGTIDEEFRSAAIVDRVNTTMSVWMGSTAGCAQCHDHKYDPLTHQEYFQLYAFFNGSADADRRNEAPLHKLFGEDQKKSKLEWQAEIAHINAELDPARPSLQKARATWDRAFPRQVTWRPASIERSGAKDPRPVVSVRSRITALRFRLPAAKRPGTVKITAARVSSGGLRPIRGRFVRITLPGKQKNLHLAEVQVWQGADNLARRGKARQSSTAYNSPARLANDGNTDGDFNRAKSTCHTATSDDPWWEVDLGSECEIDRIVVWNRTDSVSVQRRLSNFSVSLLDTKRGSVWEKKVGPAPNPMVALGPRPLKIVELSAAYRETSDQWIAILRAPMTLMTSDRLEVRLRDKAGKILEPIAVEASSDTNFAAYADATGGVLTALVTDSAKRTKAQQTELERGYLQFAPKRRAAVSLRDVLKQKLAKLKPRTTVPIMQELKKPRQTHIQIRGSYKNLGKQVVRGVPAGFHPMAADAPQDRLGLARWLVSPANPRTARVAVNRFWEQLFGAGLVTTAGDFGVQGERPTHPDLLDWLAVEFSESGWNIKALLRTIVSSATYRQSSEASPELVTRDPRNQLLARGPRFRLSAEMIRDSALAVSGLLSDKMYGASVRPPRPRLGLRAAFGGSTDWSTSAGQDRYRRGLYTSWRRTIPYPSMATFDAPSREVCTITRIRTNTPLQALVTLNDPVYVEAAQALARRILREGGTDAQSRASYGFRLCLMRQPTGRESARIVELQKQAKRRFAATPKEAHSFVTKPLGPPPAGIAIEDLAAWTLVANVLLNLDEFLVKR